MIEEKKKKRSLVGNIGIPRMFPIAAESELDQEVKFEEGDKLG